MHASKRNSPKSPLPLFAQAEDVIQVEEKASLRSVLRPRPAPFVTMTPMHQTVKKSEGEEKRNVFIHFASCGGVWKEVLLPYDSKTKSVEGKKKGRKKKTFLVSLQHAHKNR